jgi:hypothetical protein
VWIGDRGLLLLQRSGSWERGRKGQRGAAIELLLLQLLLLLLELLLLLLCKQEQQLLLLML